MRRRIAAVLLLLAALPVRGEDNRSIEVVRYNCQTETMRREVTLFANGTVRLRDGMIGREWMGLTELNPEELEGFVNRLSAENLTDIEALPQEIHGAWIERCELRLQVPGKPLRTFEFGQYDSLPLTLSRVVRIAKELDGKVAILKDKDELPANYDPQPGDILRRVGDGAPFRIVAFTSDNKGVELEGVDMPLQIFVARGDLRKQFSSLVPRDR
jgi:hypothetical protein